MRHSLALAFFLFTSVWMIGCAEGGADQEMSPLEPMLFADEECPPDVEWCDDGANPMGVNVEDLSKVQGLLGSPYDDDLHEAAGDPNSWANGVWLGAGVTPIACATSAGIGDLDADGFKDSCEYDIARSFAPFLQFYSSEDCGGGAPAWAVQSPSSGVVRIAYMPAYYLDCGGGIQVGSNVFYGGHWGDSEIVGLRVVFNASTQHWELDTMWTSAHYDQPFPFDKSQVSPASLVDFPIRPLTAPKVWVAAHKHANYRSMSRCNASFDACDNVSAFRRRFPVTQGRNVHADLNAYLTSPDYPGLEHIVNKFRGWHFSEPGVKPYAVMLSASGFYSN